MNVADAYRKYIARQLREEFPAGRLDSAGRWYPNGQTEYRDCCNHIRQPTRERPWSLQNHCRTMGHIAALCGVPVGDLRALARSQDLLILEGLPTQQDLKVARMRRNL